MPSRVFSLLVLAVLGLAHAAPAPFRKPSPPAVDVVGWHADPTLVASAPRVIVCQEDYRNAAGAWGIANPPKVDFRTHFLLVSSSAISVGVLRCRVEDGDLRSTVSPMVGGCASGPPCFHVRLTSFPRSGIRTVNGEPLPRK